MKERLGTWWRMEDAGAELVHVDVIDGVFCPQMTVEPPFVDALGSSPRWKQIGRQHADRDVRRLNPS
jgi:pentose-5-phosphate-3-epimerase